MANIRFYKQQFCIVYYQYLIFLTFMVVTYAGLNIFFKFEMSKEVYSHASLLFQKID